MKRWTLLIYGGLCYAVFTVTFLHLIAFVTNRWLPNGIDRGEPGPWGLALVVDLALLAVFGLQHSVMARPGFKRWWTRAIPPAAERSTYVLCSSLALLLLFWQWRPLPAVIWSTDDALAQAVLHTVRRIGWLITLVSTFLTSHLDLFGLRQVYLRAIDAPYQPVPFRTTFLYRFVRHPMMLGLLIAFWTTWHMTAGHLLFAVVMTLYILVGLRFEERDLQAAHGAPYARYRREVPMLLPWPRRVGRRAPTAGAND
jgi:protein-S-isoprenylcysteine O-methyltransferase Ste14